MEATLQTALPSASRPRDSHIGARVSAAWRMCALRRRTVRVAELRNWRYFEVNGLPTMTITGATPA